MQRWSEAEVNKLVGCVEKGLSGHELEKVFPNRSYASIMAKKDKLGLVFTTRHISEEELKRFVNDINRLCVAAGEYSLRSYDLRKEREESFTLKQNFTSKDRTWDSFCFIATEESERRMFHYLLDVRDLEVRAGKLKYDEYKKQYELSKDNYLKSQLTLLKSCIDILERYQ